MSTLAVETNDQGAFFRTLAHAKHRILIVDYDGTLAPFNADRHRAVPYENTPEYLRCIMSSCATRVIVVSGRPAREVPPLLGLNPAPEIWGTNGIERIDAGGIYEEVHVNEPALEALAIAEARLEREGFRDHLEIKLAGVALHWRGLGPAEGLKMKAAAFRILAPLALGPDLVLTEFEEGVEIRLASANKGEALRKFLDKLDDEIPIAYLGDDATDEDAFRVLNGRGLSVLVRPAYRFTAAQLWLKPPDQLIEFLTRWIHTCGGVE